MKKIILLFVTLIVFVPSMARAGQDHLSIGAGLIHLPSPSQTDFELSAEYEHRYNGYFGLGAFGSYIFSTPTLTILGVPEVFFHPLSGSWIVSAAPIFEWGWGSTNTGVRVGTRFPLPAGIVTLIPSFYVDFINGGDQYTFGLGIAF